MHVAFAKISFLSPLRLFLSSEVKETVMAEPEKLPESSEEVRVHYSAGLIAGL